MRPKIHPTAVAPPKRLKLARASNCISAIGHVLPTGSLGGVGIANNDLTRDIDRAYALRIIMFSDALVYIGRHNDTEHKAQKGCVMWALYHKLFSAD